MRFFVSVFLMAFLSFASCLFFPWWSIAVVCFVVSFLSPNQYGKAFLIGFVALFLLWFGLSFWLSFKNNHILAQRISVLILNMNSPFLLVLLTAFIGAVVGGFSSLSGSLLRGKPKN